MQPSNLSFGQQPAMEFAGGNPNQFYNQGSYYIVQQQYSPQQIQAVYQPDRIAVQNPGVIVPNGLENVANVNKNTTLDLKKTKLCPNIKQGHCIKGDRCNFAHTADELRNRPNLHKTKMCPNIQKKGGCEFGDSCNFAHSELELRSTPDIYKTSLCNNFMAGECKLGDLCRFAHGDQELRKKPQNHGFDKSGQHGHFGQPRGGHNNRGGNARGGPGGRPSFGGKPRDNGVGRPQPHVGYPPNQVVIQPGLMPQQQAFMDEKGMIVYHNAPVMMNGVGGQPQGAYVVPMPVEQGQQQLQAQYQQFQTEINGNSQQVAGVQNVGIQPGTQQVQTIPGYAQVTQQQGMPNQQVQMVGQQQQMMQQVPQTMQANIQGMK